MSFWTMPLPGLMRKRAGGLNVADVFSTDLYVGTGSAVTITNGVNLLGEGGIVWSKSRASGTRDHVLTNTEQGGDSWLRSTNNAASAAAIGIRAFNNNGFTTNLNVTVASGEDFIGWTLRRSPKFFDVRFTSHTNGTPTTVAHGLGGEPGLVLQKRTDLARDWSVRHRSESGLLKLNSNAAASGTATSEIQWDGSTVTIPAGLPSGQYLLVLFAHDPSASGIIQCGAATATASATASVDLGFEPQFLLWKNSATTGDWYLADNARGFGAGADPYLRANLANAEASLDLGAFTSNGFTLTSTSLVANEPFIYLAIRAEGV